MGSAGELFKSEGIRQMKEKLIPASVSLGRHVGTIAIRLGAPAASDFFSSLSPPEPV